MRPTATCTLFTDRPGSQYEVRDLLARIVDARNENGNPPDFPTSTNLSTARASSARGSTARVRRRQPEETHDAHFDGDQGRRHERARPRAMQMPGVIYDGNADKAARFIMDCNQRKILWSSRHDRLHGGP